MEHGDWDGAIAQIRAEGGPQAVGEYTTALSSEKRTHYYSCH